MLILHLIRQALHRTAAAAVTLAYRLPLRIFSPYFQNSHGAGQPNRIATPANTVFALPHPKLAYIAGANSGNPKPAKERKAETAASADAAYSVNVSITYAWMDWVMRIEAAPTKNMP